jgi:Uma2 family endonuclease
MMVLLTEQAMTLEEFLAFDDGTEASYELENGSLRQMPSESDQNQRIATFLLLYFAQSGIPFYRLRMGLEMAASGLLATVRVPDLTVLSEEGAEQLKGSLRSLITLDMPPPALVVEVVSLGQENIDRDYRFKRSQYESRGIPEYWIVDPMLQQVTVLTWVRGLYEEKVYKTGDPIESAWVQGLKVKQVLSV